MTKISTLALLFALIACTVSAQYCIPAGNYPTGINNFQINDIINYGSPDNVPYTFYPQEAYTTWMTIGQDYAIQISSNDFIVDRFKLWIDLNNDTIFSENELLLEEEGTISEYITIPDNPAFIGVRRLRVMVGSYESFNACNWSGTHTGEAEDYVVNITDSLVTTAYCRPMPNSAGAFPILNFKFNTLHNCGSGYTPEAYIEYPDSVFTTELEIGEEYPIYASKQGAGVSGGFAAFIDYNDDHIFQYNEKIFQVTGGYGGSGDVNIPDDPSIVGRHLLRVRSAWGANSLNGCYTYSSGETEDYWITVIPAVPDTDTIVPPPANRWRFMYGLPDKQRGSVITESYDKGFIITGVTGDNFTPYVLKISIDGDTLWSRTYSTVEGRYPLGMDTTIDGGFVHCGVSWEEVFYGGSYIMKANACGDKEWSYNYGQDYEYHWMEDVFQCEDGSYITTTHYFAKTWDNYTNRFGLAKIDTAGILQWSQNYSEYYVHDMTKSYFTSDGNILINSYGYLPLPWDTTSYYIKSIMLKVDLNGNVVWKNVYDTINQISCYTLASTEVPGKGYLSIGYVWDSISDRFFPSTFMTSINGQMKWTKPIDQDDFDRYSLFDIERIEDNLYAILAEKYDACDDYEVRTAVITIDSSGNVLHKTWEGAVRNWAASIAATSNGKILVLATNKPGEYQSSFFVMKYNTDLTFDTVYNVTLKYDSICEAITPVYDLTPPTDAKIKIYPNPTDRFITVEVTDLQNYSISIYNAQGLMIESFPHLSSGKTFIDLYQNNPGIYMIRVQSNDRVWIGKVVLHLN